MKTNTFSLIIAGFVSILPGCSYDPLPELSGDNANVNYGGHFVTMGHILDYTRKTAPGTKSNGDPDCTIEPFVGPNADTLMYLINYGNGQGWKIMSSDQRTPAILAEGETGSFSFDTDNEGLLAWMECVATDMSIIRSLDNASLTFSEEEVDMNKLFWEGDSPAIVDPPIFDDEGGHWETTTTSSVEICEIEDHMVPKWDQKKPYNKYCPLKNDGSGLRAPAGCTALAAAAVLYYLNGHSGFPTHMYSNATCTGTIDSFQMFFSDSSDTIWETMLSEYNGSTDRVCSEAILIAYVGSLLGMKYGNQSSGASDANLKEKVFNKLGINCSFGLYNENTVRTNLINRIPVIVGAYTSIFFTSGHSFVIDGFKRTRTRYTHYHYWVPDDPSSFYDPSNQYASYTTTTYSPIQMSGIKINWGWSTQWSENPLNDGWYTLTGSWHTESGGGSGSNYNYYRTMTYGFSSL